MKSKSFALALSEKPQLGICSVCSTAGIIERIGRDWDWCWIDAQHGEWSVDGLTDAVRTCDLIDIYSLVRVPGHEAGVIGRALDSACHAVMVPMVDTVSQAEAVVSAARFAPRGRRSYGGKRPIDLYGRGYSHADRPQPLLVCQIESSEALNNVEAIAAVDGVDALFFGPDDLSQGMEMKMDTPRPTGIFDAEMKRIADAAAAEGKVAGGIFTTPDAVRKAIRMGYQLIVCCGDAPLLSIASGQAARACREALG